MSTVKARIGLFGGSFNPVHEGHINVAKHAIEALHLDELIFIPCYKSVDKNERQYAPAHHRVVMLLQVLPAKCSISTFEIDQHKEVQTIETLKYFWDIFKGAHLFFIMGADNLEGIETWKDYEKLDEYANLVVFRRLGDTVRKTKGLKIKFMNNSLWDYSSSKVRSGSAFGMDVNIEIYIRENKLYGYVG